MLGRLAPASGDAHLGPGVVVGELDQARAPFKGADALLPRFEAASGLLQNESRSASREVRPHDRPRDPGRRLALARRADPSVVGAPLGARVSTAWCSTSRTNHLDLPAIEQLEQALAGFSGTVLLVTHDRALLEAVTLTRRVELVDGDIASDTEVS